MSGIDEGATRALGTHRARATLLDTQSPKAAQLESAASAGPAAYEVFKQVIGMDPMKDGPLILPLDWIRPPPVSVEVTADYRQGIRYQNFMISERSTATRDRVSRGESWGIIQ